ncbi:hypothetical protein [Streptomyces auratus]|uniref:Uncharacterized protein n=1 Tax=Streptomyces auratus AGR0001 TaxID=1160718 RepID=J2K475_9ACTN|nr:hypothetical protein [Streptomyces auratus]
MTQHSALEQLMGRARGPMGPAIEWDFGVAGGPLAELGQVISRMNGFFLFNGGIQVFRVGEEGLGPDTRQPDPARSLLGAPAVSAVHPSHGDAWPERLRSAG